VSEVGPPSALHVKSEPTMTTPTPNLPTVHLTCNSLTLHQYGHSQQPVIPTDIFHIQRIRLILFRPLVPYSAGPRPSIPRSHPSLASTSSLLMAALQPPPLPVPPPSQVTLQPAWSASHCHPVFFTQKLRRQPLAFAAPPALHASPIVHGYAYQDALRNKTGANGTSGPRL
jgi:hypothetical protein